MKNQISWAIALLYLCISCSPKPAEQSYSMVGPSLSLESSTMWIAPKLGGTIQMPAGVMTTEDCYKTDSRSRLMQDAESIRKHFASNHSNHEFLCHPIEGFEYHEGYVYQIKVLKSYSGNQLTSVTLEEILFSEIDQTYAKEETVKMWVRNQIQPGSEGKAGSNSNEKTSSKILVQYGKNLDLNGEFTPIEIPEGYEHNPKYITQISVKRNHISAQNEVNYNDNDQSFKDSFIEEYKRLVGDQNLFPTTVTNTPTIAYAKTQRRTIQTSYSKSSKSYTNSNQYNRTSSNTNNEEKAQVLLSDPPSLEIVEMWVNSKRNGEDSYSDETGHLHFSDCYVTSYAPEKIDNPKYTGFNMFSNGEETEPLCMEIEGLEYEPGFLYRIEVTKHYIGDELRSVSLNKIISKKEDELYEKEEILDVWIDAERSKCYSLFGDEYECLKVQFSKKIDPEKWQGLDRIPGLEPKVGYVYHIKMKRKHLSNFELSMLADHPGYNDMMLEILEMYKKPIKGNTADSKSKTTNQKGTTSKTRRTTKKWSTKKRTVKSSTESSFKRQTSASTNRSTKIQNAQQKAAMTRDKNNSKSMVSENPPSWSNETIWLASERDGKIQTHSEVGVSVVAGCYKYANTEEVKINSDKMEYEVGAQIKKPLCLEIEGFNFEPGYFYKMDVTKGYLGNELSSVSLKNIIYKLKDPFYKK